MNKLLRSIVILEYPDKIMTAKARRPVYYVSTESRVRGKYIIPHSFLVNDRYKFDESGVMIDTQTGEPKLANPRTAGQPRYWVVNFQDIWNGNMAKQDRAMKVDKLKNIIRPYIQSVRKLPEKVFPIEINIIIYDTIMPVDISNKGVVYTKVIEDLLVSEGKIPDDSVEYINCSGSTRFVKIEDQKDKRMEILILKSDNDV